MYRAAGSRPTAATLTRCGHVCRAHGPVCYGRTARQQCRLCMRIAQCEVRYVLRCPGLNMFCGLDVLACPACRIWKASCLPLMRSAEPWGSGRPQLRRAPHTCRHRYPHAHLDKAGHSCKFPHACNHPTIITGSACLACMQACNRHAGAGAAAACQAGCYAPCVLCVQLAEASLRANELAELNQQLLSKLEMQQGQRQRVSVAGHQCHYSLARPEHCLPPRLLMMTGHQQWQHCMHHQVATVALQRPPCLQEGQTQGY